MSRAYLLGGVLLSIVIGFLLYNSAPQPSEGGQTISIKGTSVRVEIADTDAERSRGLSGHEPLRDGEGMLFVFAEEGFYSFWMHEMTFSIDILWLDAAGKVVHIEKQLSSESYPQTFTSGSPAQYVLEVPAGFADQHDIEIGEIANLRE